MAQCSQAKLLWQDLWFRAHGFGSCGLTVELWGRKVSNLGEHTWNPVSHGCFDERYVKHTDIRVNINKYTYMLFIYIIYIYSYIHIYIYMYVCVYIYIYIYISLSLSLSLSLRSVHI